MKAGDTFLIPTLDDHLWIVLSGPTVDADNVVVVCLLTWQDHYDQACVLSAGDHPFVKHETCVNYPDCRLVQDTWLEAKRTAGQLKAKAPVSAVVLERVRTSAHASDIRTEAYDVLRKQGFVP